VSNRKLSPNYPEARAGAADELRDAVPRPRRLPDEDPGPMQIEIYRRMTPGRRLEVAEQLYWSARRMKWAWLRSQHPDWSDEQVEAEVTRNFSHARS
jgi:hypothetical protein